MKTVGIYTIQSMNYGNRLQNYATQEVLKSMGIKAISIKNADVSDRVAALENRIPQLRQIRSLTTHLTDLKDYINGHLKRNANYNFNRFNKRITYCDDFISKNELKIDGTKYDAILAGSDQIWNTEFPFVSINSFLPFAHSRKIAWSASFGVNKIEQNEEIKRCLADFCKISVRENSGAKIVKDLTGREAEVLIDPTMLLDSEQWKQVSRRPSGFSKREYVLTYFLSPKSDEAQECLVHIGKSLLVYELLDMSDAVCRCAGPSEFLYLIDHASIVLTDSFHASVFSFLFNKPFLVFDRKRAGHDMNSRIETLLSKFCIERKRANSGLDNDIWEHDYTEGYSRLMLERKKAMQFLKEAIGE